MKWSGVHLRSNPKPLPGDGTYYMLSSFWPSSFSNVFFFYFCVSFSVFIIFLIYQVFIKTDFPGYFCLILSSYFALDLFTLSSFLCCFRFYTTQCFRFSLFLFRIKITTFPLLFLFQSFLSRILILFSLFFLFIFLLRTSPPYSVFLFFFDICLQFLCILSYFCLLSFTLFIFFAFFYRFFFALRFSLSFLSLPYSLYFIFLFCFYFQIFNFSFLLSLPSIRVYSLLFLSSFFF